MTAIHQFRHIALGSILAVASVAVFAQTPAQGDSGAAGAGAGVNANSSLTSPGTGVGTGVNAGVSTGANAGTETSGQAPVPGASQRIVAPGSTDPLVQKREADASENAQYNESKKAAKHGYKQHLKAAKSERKAVKEQASDTLKAEAKGGAAADAGAQN